MRVAVLPTGKTEWLGLAKALGRLFPNHDFYSVPTQFEYNSKGPEDGFTSLCLEHHHENNPPDKAIDLVARAAQEALGDRHQRAADLVLIIDDLELYNLHQPERVIAVMRKAVAEHLTELYSRHTIHSKTQTALRTKVSFHLIVPMIEAWFFADPQALQNAGVPQDISECFSTDTDPEAFTTIDEDYLAATVESDCPVLFKLSAKKQKGNRPKWLGVLPRRGHPKGYLQWLCRAPDEPSCTSYSETDSGALALTNICWDELLDRPAHHFQFLRALIEDIEDGLETSDIAKGSASQLTSRHNLPQNAVLRNI